MSDEVVLGAAGPGEVDGVKGQFVFQPEGQSWREQYLAGEDYKELREDAALADVPDVPTLAKNYRETKSYVGRKGVIIPKDGATPEEMDQFYAALGRPEKPEGYGFKPPKDLPEGFPYSPLLDEQFGQWAHAAGLSVKSATDLRENYLKSSLEHWQQAQQQVADAVKEMEDKIRGKWGNKYEENLAGAQKALERFAPMGSPELKMLDKAIGDSPILAQLFFNIYEAMGEGELIRGSATAVKGLEDRKKEILADPDYFDANAAAKNPEKHKQLVDEMIKINEELHPQPKRN